MANPSMVPATSATRKAKRILADSRAVEEQAERMNPVNPKSQMMKQHMGLQGGSATPTMGVSQRRGGRKHTLKDHLENPMKGYGKKATEAHMMGQHLGKHIMSLHGGAFHKEFCHGLSGGAWYDFATNAFNKVKNEFVNPDSVLRRGAEDAGKKVAHEFSDPNSILRDKVVPIGAQVAQYAQPFLDAGVPGLGSAINTGFKVANYANKGAKMLGYGEGSRAKAMLSMAKPGRSRNNGIPLLSGNVDGVRGGMYGKQTSFKDVFGFGTGAGMLGQDGHGQRKVGGANTGAYEGHGMLGQNGHGQRAKRVVGSGVSARASLVKKVMAEQGLSMIEASKYVKEHGLQWK